MTEKFLATLLIMLVSMGAASASEAQLKHPNFRESIQAEVAVSGSVLVGAVSSDIQSGSDIGLIKIPPFEGQPREVCLSVLTRDGVYIARNTYVLPDYDAQTPVSLPYKHSKSHKLLSGYRQDQVAIIVIEGDCEEPGQRIILPAKAPTRNSSVLLMVNGLGATDVFVRVATSDDERPCKQLTDDKSVVFDFFCEIDLRDSGQGAELELVIARERFGRELPKAKIQIFSGSL
tara:strand:- start:14471 stop:15166 length:696 start_codon:yes stop_codon:yes gene_type:complete